MEKTLQSGWLIIFVMTLLLTGVYAFLNKNSVKFCFNKSAILTSSGIGLFFWGVSYLFNLSIDPIKAVFVLIVGTILSVFIQSLEAKKEVLAGLGTFAVFLLVYKFISPDDILLQGLFAVPVFALAVLSLMKSDEFVNNKLTSTAILLPLYSSLTWFKVQDFGVDEVFTKIILILTVSILALLSSFALDTDIKVNNLAKKAGVFVITSLLTYLVLNNFLTVPIKLVCFVISGFLFANILNLLNISSEQDNKNTFFNAIAGFILILLVGFIATRLFGTWGLLLTGLCCIGALPVESKNIVNFPAIAALFFSIKAIVQVFIQTNTLNVTGLNLNHPYVYAGLLVGFALPVLILAFKSLYDKELKGFDPFMLIISALIIPVLSIYLFHAESTGALIIALSVSALVFSVPGPIIAEKLNFNTVKNYSNAMLPLTGLAGIMLLNSQKLVDIGNLASRIQRIEVVAGVTIILAVCIIIFVKIANKEKCA